MRDESGCEGVEVLGGGGGKGDSNIDRLMKG